MDDPGWSWPAWKFGMKRDDLFTTLHDRYNTFPSSIQDAEAFQLDVSDVSRKAASTDEFHRLMAARKEQRLRELNDSLESAAVEIIANPSLIGTAQWQYAVQLFRARSLDALVRYFASYLPEDHRWHRSDKSASETDDSDSMVHLTQSSLFDDKPLSGEPLPIASSQLPPSPRSVTTAETDLAHRDYDELDTLTPARTLSLLRRRVGLVRPQGLLSSPARRLVPGLGRREPRVVRVRPGGGSPT